MYKIDLNKPGEISVSEFSQLANLEALFGFGRPCSNINLFQLVPESWVRDESLLDQAIEIINLLNGKHRLIFNAVMWDFERFKAYIHCQSSMRHHHAEPNGNLKHTLEVCHQLQSLDNNESDFELSFMLLLSLLHDAGKAVEYENDGIVKLSERGRLLGHRLTAYEWIVAAYARWQILIDEEYLKLLHLITSVKGAPKHLGLRDPAFKEFNWLSCCDKLSAENDFYDKAISLKENSKTNLLRF